MESPGVHGRLPTKRVFISLPKGYFYPSAHIIVWNIGSTLGEQAVASFV